MGVDEGAALITGIRSGESWKGRGSAELGVPARTTGARTSRLRLLRSLTVLCLALGAPLLTSSTALASGQRAHVFSFSFPGGAGGFSHPSGIAVNSTTGDVYVADREDNRVEQFEPVLGAEGQLERETYVKEFTVPHPEAIAVDNCTTGKEPCSGDPSLDDVYVVGAKKTPPDVLVYKFNANGSAVGEKPLKFKVPLGGVDVDPKGELYVYESSGRIAAYSDAETNVELTHLQAEVAGAPQPAFAVAADDRFYVGASLTSAEAQAEGDEPLKNLYSTLTDEYKALHGGSALPIVAELGANSGSVVDPALDVEPATAVAVNHNAEEEVGEFDDAYVLNVGVLAGEQVTTVSAFRPTPLEGENKKLVERHGQLIQSFTTPGLTEGDGIAVNQATGTVYVADGASNNVDVFDLQPKGRPVVEGLAAANEEPTPPASNATTLSAQVNPAGAKTTDQFEYGTGSCSAHPSPCTTVAAPEAGEGFGAQEVSVQLLSLPPGTYHYRLVAESTLGITPSAEQTFTITAATIGLPDGRAWEMVSPSEKNGAEPEAFTKEGGLIQASAGGRAITYVADGPMPAKDEAEGARNPEFTQVLSTRGSGAGWSSQNITTANATAAGIGPGIAPEYQLFSSSLALAVVDPYPSTSGSLAKPPLSPPLEGEEGNQQNTIYLRDNAPVEPTQPPSSEEAENYKRALENGEKMNPANQGFLALITDQNEPGPEFGSTILNLNAVAGATSDLSYVVFASNNVASGLYEWGGPEREKKLELASQVEGKRVAAGEATLGSQGAGAETGSDTRHAISSDGSLVFWTDHPPSQPPRLYVRDTATHETLQLDTVQAGPPPEEIKAELDPPNPFFETASADGSKVFFTDTQRLTSDSKAALGTPDLYVWERNTTSAAIAGTVRDLTAQEGAHVLAGPEGGGVIGASEDGSYVYFAANGALAPGAAPGHCSASEEVRPRGTTCNLYMRHYDAATETWEPTKLVAVISNEDLPDWGAMGEANLTYLTAGVSTNGRYLAFMSNRSLTGYDNEDVSSGKKGERMDEEVFLYDANGNEGSGRLVCASCDPTGARPRGVFDEGFVGQASESGEGLGLVIDRHGVWSETGRVADHWLAGSLPGWTDIDIARAFQQPRYLSNEGRLFFDSADALVPLAVSTRRRASTANLRRSESRTCTSTRRAERAAAAAKAAASG